MEKPTRRESVILIIVVVLVFFAWISRILWTIPGLHETSLFLNVINPLTSGHNMIRSVIYPSLFIYWAFTLHHRLIHPQVRHLAVSIAVMMVFWFTVRTIKYGIPDLYPDTIRYLWYLYYFPMLFISLLAMFTALTVGLPEGQRLSGKCNILWFIAAALFLVVITNDFHQLVFRFPDNGQPWTDHDYSYSVMYYVTAVFRTVCDVSTFVILAVKCRRSRSRIIIPLIPLFLLMLYWVGYILRLKMLRFFFGDMTAVACVMYAASLELCIRCRLIRSNTGYGELFRAGRLGAQIADPANVVCLSSADAVPLTKEQIIDAKVRPLAIDKNTLLKSRPIHFGHVLWQVDVTDLNEAIEEFEENCRELDEKNHIDRKNIEAEKTLLSLQEKNRTNDLVSRGTAAQLERIDRLLTRYDAETDENVRRRLLAGIAVLGSYIKRYGNLLLVSERTEEEDIADLIRCFEESFSNLELLGVECVCSLPQNLKLKTKDMLHIYNIFEKILEDCLFDLSHIWVNGRERKGKFLVNIEFVCDKDLSKHEPEADDFSSEPGTSRFVFRMQKGGAGE